MPEFPHYCLKASDRYSNGAIACCRPLQHRMGNMFGILGRVEFYVSICCSQPVGMHDEFPRQLLFTNPGNRRWSRVKGMNRYSEALDHFHVEGGVFADAEGIDCGAGMNTLCDDVPAAVV